MITQSYNLNLIPNGVPVVVRASQYDKASRTIQFTLYNGDQLFSIPVSSVVTVQATKLDYTGFQYPCTYSGSVVSFDIEDQMTVLAGEYPAEISIADPSDNILGTANFIFKIENAPLTDDTEISETDMPLIPEAIAAAPISIANALKSEGFAVGQQDGTDVGPDSPYYHNNSKYYSEQASSAEASALKAEGYALGQQNGTDVDSSSPYYHNNSKYYNDQSALHENAADQSRLDSEAWAVGQRNGVDVDNTDPTYQNNAKYYSEIAVSVNPFVVIDGELCISYEES